MSIEHSQKMLAMQLATQLPEDKAGAQAVLKLLNDLVRLWLYGPEEALALREGASSSNVISFTGSPETSPR